MTKQDSFINSLLNDVSFQNWANQSNQNDMEYWDSWISDNPNKIDAVNSAKSIIKGISFNKSTIAEGKVSIELAAVLERIEANDSPKILPKRKYTSFRKYASIAAVGLFLLLIGNIFSNRSSEVTHKTGFGEIIDLKLPDGTSVVLNGNSEITYDTENSRDIELKGEAYFKVKSIPSTKAKFWVTTKDLKVEVYGTQFHVNTREEKTDVLLDEGSIHLVLENGNTKKMKPGEFVSFSKEDDFITHKKVTKELPYSLWREGTYVFNNVSLKEVMNNIEHAYGLEVEFFDEELKQQLISGGIPNQNLEICLSAIEKSTGTRIVRKGNKLILIKNAL